ncbi:putative receptor-like protein kinase At5g39000 isoform X2 [Henckelia pumila]|uniref:putative receptor-like protein kinase At5g39000 isoform X2 n=1 Tax=Henckelia pumila TaxID=405737 RepID=UPI003C6DF99A
MMNLFLISSASFVICLLAMIAAATHDHEYQTGDISINCGSSENFAAADGREWNGDEQGKFSSSVQMNGPSTSSSIASRQIVYADQAQYKTARISQSRFSYAFRLSPGHKFIRLHFNPVPYRGFEGSEDLFTVEAGPYTLVRNFSASLTAGALGVKGEPFVKEFCMNIEENQPFNLTFYPDKNDRSEDRAYAFVNGIQIISMPAYLSYLHGGVQVVGVKTLTHIYDHHHTALEIIHRQKVEPSDDFVNMFGVRAAIPNRKIKKIYYVTWKTAVDVGFRYLVRVHFREFVLNIAETEHVVFEILIDEIKVDSNIYLVKERNYGNNLQYKDYVTDIEGSEHNDGKHNLSISIKLIDELMDGNGLLKGFEVLKLNNHNNSLASPNPPSSARDSASTSLQNLLKVCGGRNIIATTVIAIVILANIVVHKLWRIREDKIMEEDKKPSARAQRFCRRFSLAEIQSSTGNFSNVFVIGMGGFGKVYKGILDNGQAIVAMKRLKYSSKQGAHEFWTEIEILSKLQHINLVSLIGYCNEQQEMILAYEYMARGTLADHLFKKAMHENHYPCLSWKQRLNICIGAGRGLDYLHTGHGIIHRDVKTSNILLDENFVAKVADFGLAKPGKGSQLQDHSSTDVKGTHGYFDPYYIRTRKLTMKSDIYAFGVVLLEVLCGRPALDPRLAENQRNLATWARENISKGDTEKIISSNIRGEISLDSLNAFVQVAENCLDDEPKRRPTMAQVVLQLEFVLNLQENPNSSVSKETSTANGSSWDALRKSIKSFTQKDLEASTSDIERRNQLPWTLRFKLIIGIARGVRVLHQSPELRTIYSSLDPCNIFLGTGMNPKIAIEYCKPTTVEALRTSDYTAPEGCQVNQRYSSDIYSFGVIVLEIVSGWKHRRSKQHLNLIAYAWKLWKEGKALDLVNTKMGRRFPGEEAITCIQVALLCTQFEPQHRPEMALVLRALYGDQDLEMDMREAANRRYNPQV